MTILDTLNFVSYNPLQNNNPIATRRRKLFAKIDEQIQLAANKDYTPTQHKWVTDEHGNQRKEKDSKGIAKAKPFPSVKPPTTSAATSTPQATPNSAVGTQSFTSKDISDIRNDYLQKQSELQPIKPQSPF